jgi:hypothetical protein
MLRTTLRSNVVRNRRRFAPTADLRSRREASMMFRTPSGCETIKKTKKQKNFLFFVFLFVFVIQEPFRVLRTSWEVINPVSLKHPQDLLIDKHKQKETKNKKTKKIFIFCFFVCVCIS